MKSNEITFNFPRIIKIFPLQCFQKSLNSPTSYYEPFLSNVIHWHSRSAFQNSCLFQKETRQKWLNVFLRNNTFPQLIPEVCNLVWGEFACKESLHIFCAMFTTLKLSNRCSEIDFTFNSFKGLTKRIITTFYYFLLYDVNCLFSFC